MNPVLTSLYETIDTLRETIGERIVWQRDTIDRLIIALFSWWHILLEWVPWLAKTLMVRTLAESLDLEFGRISFTPDLLPSDLIGSEVYRPQTAEFYTRKWPIFTEILLADEINRTPPKVHAALLEAMQERGVTIGDTTYTLWEVFTVIATENPIEQEWTYRLPEAELDRFQMKCLITYPSHEEEIRIMTQETQHSERKPDAQKSKQKHTLTRESISSMRVSIRENVRVDEKIYDYVNRIVRSTRPDVIVRVWEKLWEEEPETPLSHGKKSTLKEIYPYIEYGASPRAGIALVNTARVLAIMGWRDYVLPEDIKALAPDVLRHRIGLSYTAIGERVSADVIIAKVLENILVP